MSTKTVMFVKNLTKIYQPSLFNRLFGKEKPFVAVDGISFELKEGEILGLLGPNGSGKTTTIHMLLGVLSKSSGDINYFGKDFSRLRSEIMAKVAFASTYVRFPGNMTVAENLDVYGRLYGLTGHDRAERVKHCLQAFGMWEYRNRYASALSAGQMTRSVIAKAFLARPRVVLLDEPTASLDPEIAAVVRNFVLEQQREHGVSMLFTSHNMAEVEEVCDRLLVMKRGVIIANNTPQKLAESISTAHVELMVSSGAKALSDYLTEKKYAVEWQEHFVKFSVQEQQIARVLSDIAQRGIEYSQISIDKPTLEDYFLHVARGRGNA
ncbi:ABC transporter ATP-binding protein [bacterium]|nr:ABC transporter ATP-binding protein [bacterium]MBT3903327.1 ABC transporter ATP-binding protein [bacterium]MBT4577823.1 ABC transporter ATP-binding protein [bacterium]MBT5345515.1 ABC transporter ATP-binding protein [bacterium]MBT6131209.1 ABC transporter ATP-binding protein [bacterium]